MSEYENVVGGKLRLKGNPLDVKGISKKRKYKKHYEQIFNKVSSDIVKEIRADNGVDEGNEMASTYDEKLTPAERRYLEQWKHLEAKRLLRTACESHRDRINKFNEHLANLSEHYDIPKVGPG